MPLTIKKCFSGNHRVDPFVNAGITARYKDVKKTRTFSSASGTPLGPFTTKQRDWHIGPILGVGVDIGALPLRLSPKVRWTNRLDNWSLHVNGLDVVGPARQTVDFVLGIKFK